MAWFHYLPLRCQGLRSACDCLPACSCCSSSSSSSTSVRPVNCQIISDDAIMVAMVIAKSLVSATAVMKGCRCPRLNSKLALNVDAYISHKPRSRCVFGINVFLVFFVIYLFRPFHFEKKHLECWHELDGFASQDIVLSLNIYWTLVVAESTKIFKLVLKDIFNELEVEGVSLQSCLTIYYTQIFL